MREAGWGQPVASVKRGSGIRALASNVAGRQAEQGLWLTTWVAYPHNMATGVQMQPDEMPTKQQLVDKSPTRKPRDPDLSNSRTWNDCEY
jgi:hypothetical protein